MGHQHGYGVGSQLRRGSFIEGDRWTAVARWRGAAPWHTGGGGALTSTDAGDLGAERQVTRDSTGNHSPYAAPTTRAIPSTRSGEAVEHVFPIPDPLHGSGGTQVFTLPYTMEGDDAAPIPVE